MKNPWKKLSKINPQREEGNIQINMSVFEQLLGADLEASEYKVIFYIIRKTYGYNKNSDALSRKQIKTGTNLSERMVKYAIKDLKEMRIIYYQPSKIRGQRGSPLNEYLFNKHYDTWKLKAKKRGQRIARGQQSVKKGATERQKRGQRIAPTIENYTIENYNRNNTTSEVDERGQRIAPLKKIPENNIEYKLSKKLYSLILKNNSKAKKPDFQKWAGHVEKLIRIDKRTPEEISNVIQWVQQDDFWMGNILSTNKLRKQFPQLLIKFNKSSKTNNRFTKNLMAMEEFLNG